MADDYSISGIYEEALRGLQERRAQAGQASKAAYERLAQNTQAAYEALDREAAINRALSDRANGRAGEGITTLAQRRETNLMNTLGDNSRARERTLDSVELAQSNDMTRRAADDTALAAQFAAAEDQALLSQDMFGRQLGLGQRQLDLQKKQSEFSQAQRLFADNLINAKGFEGMTGIKVRKPPKPLPLIIDCGTEEPAARRGYEVRTTTDKQGVTHYYQVSKKLIADAAARGISIYEEARETDINAAMHGGAYLNTRKNLKSDAQLYAEVYYEGFWGASPEEQRAILEENKEDFERHFGGNYYALYTDYLERWGSLLEFDLPELERVEAVLRDFDYLAGPDEMQSAFDQYNEACTTAFKAIAEKYSDSISWDSVQTLYPEIAEQFVYSDSAEDAERKWLGLAPASFTSEAFAEALEEMWVSEVPDYSSATYTTPPLLSPDPPYVRRKHMLEALGVDLGSLSVQEIMALAAYMDFVSYDYDEDTVNKQGRGYLAVITYGKSLYAYYSNKDEVIGEVENLPAGVKAAYILNISGSDRGLRIVGEPQIALAEEIWSRLSEEERYNLALKMIRDNYGYLEAQHEQFKRKMIVQGQTYIQKYSYHVTDDQIYLVESVIYYLENLDQTEAYEAATEDAMERYHSRFMVASQAEIVIVANLIGSSDLVIWDARSGLIVYEKDFMLMTVSDSGDSVRQRTASEINDIISFLIYLKSIGQYDENLLTEQIRTLYAVKLGDVVEFIESREEGCYFELTEGAVEMIRADMYDLAEEGAYLDFMASQNETDFIVFSAQGAAIQNPSAVDVLLIGSDVLNPVMFAKYINSDLVMEELNDPALVERGVVYEQLYSDIEKLRIMYSSYTYMKDEEVGVYNYLLAKKGEEYANRFLDLIQETLNQRQGTADAEAIADQPVAQVLYSPVAGLDQWASGIRQLFSSDRLPTSVVQFTSDAIEEDLADSGIMMPEWLGGKSVAQMAYKAGKGIGYAAPGILLTAVTAGYGAPIAIAGEAASALVMGLSIKGNAYNWALGQGYDKAQAETYSILIGVGAIVLQYAFKGIMSYVGKSAKNVINQVVTEIDSGLFRAASKIRITYMGEGAEVYLQNELQPALTNIALGGNRQLLLTPPRTVYPTIFGSITTGILKAGPGITSNIDENLAGMAVMQANKFDELINQALTLDPNTEAHNLAKELSAGSAKADNYNAGKLLMDYIDADGDTSFMNRPPETTQDTQIQTGENPTPQLTEPAGESELNAIASRDVQALVGDTAQELQALSNQTGLDLYNNAVNNAYLQFGQNPTNGNALALYNAALQSLGDAIAQQQAGIIQLTESQVNAINAQINSINTRVSELVSQGQAQTGGTTQTQPAASQRAIADAITTLLRLPANAQIQANVEAARQAYYDYLTASPENKAAAYDRAVKLLGESVSAVLENPSLDAGTRAALEELLGEIDSGKGMGDNHKDNYIIFNEMHKDSLPVPKGKGPNGGRLQSHHGLQREWTNNNLSQYGYDPELAPTITIETGQGFPHTVITNNQNQRKNERIANGQGKWSSTLQEELQYLINDLLEAGFSREDIEKVLEQQYRMFEKLGVKYERIEF